MKFYFSNGSKKKANANNLFWNWLETSFERFL